MYRANVVSLDDYRRKDLIACLESMLASAKEGSLEGLIYVARMRNSDQHAAAVGNYVEDPAPGLIKAIECLVAVQNKKDGR